MKKTKWKNQRNRKTKGKQEKKRKQKLLFERTFWWEKDKPSFELLFSFKLRRFSCEPFGETLIFSSFPVGLFGDGIKGPVPDPEATPPLAFTGGLPSGRLNFVNMFNSETSRKIRKQ